MDQKNELYTCKTGSEQGNKFKVKMILAKVPFLALNAKSQNIDVC